MTWGPLPPSTLDLPIRRQTFIDITVSGSATIGGTLTGGDILSSNWDGTDPLDLSGGPDDGASKGYALDGSEGAIQIQTLYAEGGEIGNLDIVNALTLQTGGTIRTASSGQRIEITEDERDRIRLFTGEETEAISGVLRAGSFGEDETLVLYSSLYAPTNDNDETNTTYLQIRSPSDDDSSVAPGINLAYGGSSTQAPELQLQNNFSIRVIDGDVWIEDGLLQVGGNILPWTDNAHDLGSADLSWADIHVDGQLFLAGGGSTSAPAVALEADTGIYRRGGGEIGFSLSNHRSWIMKRVGDIVYLVPYDTTSNVEDTRLQYNTGSAQWSFYINNVHEMTLGATGFVVPNVYDNASGASNTVYVDTNGNLHRASSSRRTKKYITPAPFLADVPLNPVRFNMKKNWQGEQQGWFYGFIAEDIVEYLPDAGVYAEDGQVDDYDLRAVVAVLAAKVNKLEALALT